MYYGEIFCHSSPVIHFWFFSIGFNYGHSWQGHSSHFCSMLRVIEIHVLFLKTGGHLFIQYLGKTTCIPSINHHLPSTFLIPTHHQHWALSRLGPRQMCSTERTRCQFSSGFYLFLLLKTNGFLLGCTLQTLTSYCTMTFALSDQSLKHFCPQSPLPPSQKLFPLCSVVLSK